MALRDLLKDDVKGTDTKSNKGGGTMERIEVTSDHTLIDEVDTGGSALVGEEAEMAEAPKTVDGEVVELGKFENDSALDMSNFPSEISIDSATMERSALFTEAEKNALEELEKSERISDSDKASLDRVQSALESSEYASNRTDLYYQLAKEEGRFGLDEIDYDSTEEAVLDQLGHKDWVTPENPENKKVEDMTGGELAEILQNSGGSEQEQLEENPEPEETEEELSVPEVPEESEQVIREWEARGGCGNPSHKTLNSRTIRPITKLPQKTLEESQPKIRSYVMLF